MNPLPARLLAAANEIDADADESQFDYRDLLREAAAALSGGEAVACDVLDWNGDTVAERVTIEYADELLLQYAYRDCKKVNFLYTAPQPGDGVVVLSYEQLADFASKCSYSLEEAAGTIELLNEAITAAPSAKGVANG